MDSLKPCPFCGSDRVGLSYCECLGGKRHDKPLVRVFVKCRACGGQGHLFTASRDGVTLYGRRSMREAERKAVEWWNRREERTGHSVYHNDSWFQCSECGAFVRSNAVTDTTDYLAIRYCPNCGAKVVRDGD